MNRRRLLRWGIPVAIVCLGGIVALLWAVASRNHSETDRLIVTWETGSTPMRVEGVVVDEGARPVPGLQVQLDNDSGGMSAVTDQEGRFTLDMGEPGVRGMDVQGVDKIEWGTTGFGQLDCTKGLRFRIVVKHKD